MIILVVVIVTVVNNVVLINAKIPSPSMEKTIMTGDRIFGFRLAYGINIDFFGHNYTKKFRDPERFDIVIFKYPDDERKLYIKRVIGLPGEKVQILNGRYILTIPGHRWMTALYRKHPREISDHIRCRRTAILSWGTTGIIPRIPGSGRPATM